MYNTRTRLEKYKHFVDLNYSHFSLLIEAIEAYPHFWNACEKFTYRFRAFMLKTLADMLLFLRSESVGSVNPEREKEFLKPCDEAVQLGFEKSWVDEMRQRVVGRDPNLEHARVIMGELFNRHDYLTEELDSIKAPIGELLKRYYHLTQELHSIKSNTDKSAIKWTPNRLSTIFLKIISNGFHISNPLNLCISVQITSILSNQVNLRIIQTMHIT
ncbi:hypothetical protein V8G54_026718 [Vigna mungo]|uniref:Uncharacterized protein n=1 Tax=Vigna mungo TaxID=3915 RepID=A0AAQ3RQ67_VIGMU